MRKIENQEIKEKKESRNKIILSLILVGVLILSTAGYAFYNTNEEGTEEVEMNGLKFVKNNMFWDTVVESQGFSFQNLPNETADIQVNLFKNLNDFRGKPLYFSEQNPGSQEILMNIGAYVERVQLACISEPCKDNLPIKNCSDSNFVVFQSGEINKVSSEENCIYILYRTGEETKATDAFLYKILGIT